jgi:hypothetical protein
LQELFAARIVADFERVAGKRQAHVDGRRAQAAGDTRE